MPANSDRPPALASPDEIPRKFAELSAAFTELSGTVAILRGQLGEKDAIIRQAEDQLQELDRYMEQVRLNIIDNKQIELSTFEQIAGALVRIGIITALGGLVGAPMLAWITKAAIVETMIEGSVTAFVAAVSTEVANRVADPTSHRHRS